MDYLGLFALGAFVGSIAALGVRYINSVESWQKVLLALLPAVLSGVAIAFLDRFRYSPALGAYPLGLIIAFLWTYIDVAAARIAPTLGNDGEALVGGSGAAKYLGWLHLGASVVATAAAIVIILPPVIRQMQAEWSISVDENARHLKSQRSVIRAQTPDTGAVNRSRDGGASQTKIVDSVSVASDSSA